MVPLGGARAESSDDDESFYSSIASYGAGEDDSSGVTGRQEDEEETPVARGEGVTDLNYTDYFSTDESDEGLGGKLGFGLGQQPSFFDLQGPELGDLQVNPLLSGSTLGLADLRFETATRMMDPARMVIRGEGRDSSPTNFEPGVQTYVDDVFLPFTTGGIFSLIDEVDVAVDRGPQPNAGGKNSIGGTVRIRTVRPQPEWGAGTTVTYGNLGTLRSETTLNVPLNLGPFKERAFGRFSLATRSADGFLENVPTKSRSGDDSLLGGRAALRFLPTDNTEINLTWDRTTQDTNQSSGQCRDVKPFTPGRLILDSLFTFKDRCARSGRSGDVDKSFVDSLRNLDANEQGLSATVDVDLGSWRLTSLSGYRSLDLVTGAGDDDDTDLNIVTADKTKNRRDALSQELRLYGSLMNDRLRLLTGASVFTDRGELSGGFSKFGSLNFMDGLGVSDGMPVSATNLSVQEAAQRLGVDPSRLAGTRVSKDELGRTVVATVRPDSRVDFFNNLTALGMARGSLVNGQPTRALFDQLFQNAFSTALMNPESTPSFQDESRSRTYAGYFNTEFDLTDRLTLGGGLRYTTENKDEDTQMFSRTAAGTMMPMNMAMMNNPMAPASRLMVLGGSRSSTFSELTPSADLTYRYDENVTLLGRYARGFTAGVVGEDKAETLDTYELGLRSRWFNDRVLVNLTSYYSTRDNIQVDVSLTDALGQNVRRRVNDASGTIAGLDLDFQTSWRTRIGSLDFGGGLGLIDAKYTKFRTNVDAPLTRGNCTGPGLADCPLNGIASLSTDVVTLREGVMVDPNNPLSFRPEDVADEGVVRSDRAFGQFADNVDTLFGNSNVRRNVDRTDLKFQNTPSVSYNLFLRYQVDMQKLGAVSASTSYYQQSSTAQNFFNTVEQGTYGVMDLSFSWAHPNGRLFVGAYMNNALNKRYIEGASDSADFDGAETIFFSRPRTYGIQVGYQFGGAR